MSLSIADMRSDCTLAASHSLRATGTAMFRRGRDPIRRTVPFGRADQRAGYWWETSMRQVEVSRTIVLDAPRRARAFFEALIADNLDLGCPGRTATLRPRPPGAAAVAPTRRHRLSRSVASIQQPG